MKKIAVYTFTCLLACGSSALEAQIAGIEFQAIRDHGITSDFHKSHIGTIVFSKSRIPAGSEATAGLTNSFTEDDPIFGRFYLSKSLYNCPTLKKFRRKNPAEDKKLYPNFTASFGMHLYCDGKLISDEDYKPGACRSISFIDMSPSNRNEDHEMDPEEKKKLTTIEFVVSPTKALINDNSDTEWLYMTEPMCIGKHTIKVEIYPLCIEADSRGWYYSLIDTLPACVGEYTYIKTNKFLNKGPSWSSVKEEIGMKSPEIESAMKAAFSKYEDYKDSKVTVVKAQISSNGWEVIKNNATGAIIKRVITGVIVYKDSDGDGHYIFDANFIQDYVGGKYGNMYLSQFSGPYVVDVSTVK
ncbi:MAG: hypothetical protein ACXVPN_02655 [Bacteroidia bacterium]